MSRPFLYMSARCSRLKSNSRLRLVICGNEVRHSSGALLVGTASPARPCELPAFAAFDADA
jgi:hypothetical protein